MLSTRSLVENGLISTPLFLSKEASRKARESSRRLGKEEDPNFLLEEWNGAMSLTGLTWPFNGRKWELRSVWCRSGGFGDAQIDFHIDE